MNRRGFVPYGPARAGAEAMSRIMAADLDSTGITVNILLTGGATDTGMIPAEQRPAQLTLIDPAVMGPPIVWLASSQARGVHDERIVATRFGSGCGTAPPPRHPARKGELTPKSGRPFINVPWASEGTMSDVSLADAWPRPGEPFRAGDLDPVPDDGHRYALPDGTLIVSPAPGLPHQVAAAILCHALELACPEDLVAFLSAGTELGVPGAVGPDAVVARRSGTRLIMPPLLVAEVLPPDSGLPDPSHKKTAYERFGVPSYWLIDPDRERPSLRAFRLVGGRYHETAHAAGDVPFRVEQPFPVEIVPSRLVAKLRTR